MDKIVTPIIKPVSSQCNISCRYCYHKGLNGTGACMSEGVLRAFISDLAVLPQKHIRFIWHGGEPTLAGLEFYANAMELQSKYFVNDVAVKNSIQTNGTTITPKWTQFLKNNRFSVGISLDGPRCIHDVFRVNLSSHGTFDRVMKSICLLKDVGITPGIVCSVTKQSASSAREIFKFFYENKLFRLNFSPVADFDTSGTPASYSLSPQEWSQFLKDLFDIWMEYDDRRVKIQLFDSLLQGLMGGCARLCSCRRDCTEFISIDHDGSVYFCGRFLGNQKFCLGKVGDSFSFASRHNNKTLQEISQKISSVRGGCIDCEWKTICNGGCADHRYHFSGSIDGPYFFCDSIKIILAHMRERLEKFGLVDSSFTSDYNTLKH